MLTKQVFNKKIPFYLSPVRYFYRKFSSLIFREIKLVQITHNGLKYLLWAHEDVGKRLILQRRYEQTEMSAFSRLIMPGDICIDVGGNVGIYSLYFAKLCGFDGHVYVIEPIRKNRLVINLAAEINTLDNISVYPYALSNCEGVVELEIPSIDGAYAYMKPGVGEEVTNSLGVRCLSLDCFLQEEGIDKVDILKIDVEGAEKLVLDGAVELLSDLSRRPRVIMIELVDDFLERFGSNVSEALSMMRTLGYSPFYADSDGHMSPFRDNDINRIFNVFFLCDRG